MSDQARFNIGQIIHHNLFNYRGVIVDVDPDFQGSNKWYELIAQSRAPKEEPWYYVLVDNAIHRTYVAEQNIDLEEDLSAITHPELDIYFKDFQDGIYILHQKRN